MRYLKSKLFSVGLVLTIAPPAGIDDASARHESGHYAMLVIAHFENVVDAGVAQAYVGIITSVPHGTSSVRLKGRRSAHPVGAHRARHRAQSQTSQTDARRTKAVRRRVY
jgi:hypothetical protein